VSRVLPAKRWVSGNLWSPGVHGCLESSGVLESWVSGVLEFMGVWSPRQVFWRLLRDDSPTVSKAAATALAGTESDDEWRRLWDTLHRKSDMGVRSLRPPNVKGWLGAAGRIREEFRAFSRNGCASVSSRDKMSPTDLARLIDAHAAAPANSHWSS
jgi:hypothetical protein